MRDHPNQHRPAPPSISTLAATLHSRKTRGVRRANWRGWPHPASPPYCCAQPHRSCLSYTLHPRLQCAPQAAALHARSRTAENLWRVAGARGDAQASSHGAAVDAAAPRRQCCKPPCRPFGPPRRSWLQRTRRTRSCILYCFVARGGDRRRRRGRRHAAGGGVVTPINRGPTCAQPCVLFYCSVVRPSAAAAAMRQAAGGGFISPVS